MASRNPSLTKESSASLLFLLKMTDLGGKKKERKKKNFRPQIIQVGTVSVEYILIMLHTKSSSFPPELNNDSYSKTFVG